MGPIWPLKSELEMPVMYYFNVGKGSQRLREIGLSERICHLRPIEMCMAPLQHCLLCPSQHSPIVSWGVPYDHLTEEEKTQDCLYRPFRLMSKNHIKVDSCSTLVPSWDIQWRTVVKDYPPSRQNFEWYT